MMDAIATSHYAGGQIDRISVDLAHLERITLGDADPLSSGREMVAASPGGRAITVAMAGLLVGFVLCLPGDTGADLGLTAAATGLSAERSRGFTRSALRVFAPVVAPAAAGLGVGEMLLGAAAREQPDGRIFTVLPGRHPANRIARAAGWHEVLRNRSGIQLLLHPDHPALAEILLQG